MALCTKLHHTVWVPGLSSIIYFTWANQARNVFPASFHLQTHLLHFFVTTADPAQLQTQISIALGWLKVLCPYNWQSSKLCRNDPMFALMEKGWILSTWTLYLWMKVTITEKKKKKATAILWNSMLPVFAFLEFDQVWSWRTKGQLCANHRRCYWKSDDKAHALKFYSFSCRSNYTSGSKYLGAYPNQSKIFIISTLSCNFWCHLGALSSLIPRWN